MPSANPVRLEHTATHATITLTNPDRANALSAHTVSRLGDILGELETRPRECVIIRAQGRAFCGGFDLDDVVDATDDALRDRFVDVQDVLTRLGELPAITVAVVSGAAIGAGADLVAACDIRASTSAGLFQFPGPRFGLLLGTERQHQILTPEGFADMVVRTRRVDAATAHRYGLLTHLIADADPDAWPRQVAADLARRGDGARDFQLDLLRGRGLPRPPDLVRRSLAAPEIAQRIGLTTTRDSSHRKDPSS